MLYFSNTILKRVPPNRDAAVAMWMLVTLELQRERESSKSNIIYFEQLLHSSLDSEGPNCPCFDWLGAAK